MVMRGNGLAQAWQRSVNQIAVLVVCVGTFASGCSDGGNEDGATLGPQESGFALAKAASSALARHQVVVAVSVSSGDAPVAGVQVAFSRSVSGRATDYRWVATTDSEGRAEVGISTDTGAYNGASVNGMYLAKATNPATGEIVGKWGSIPLNGGRRVDLDLAVGARAHVRAQASLSQPSEFLATVDDFVGYANWQVVDYTVGLTNPVSGSAHESLTDTYSRRVFRNARAAVAGDAYPNGSILVKEVFTWNNGQKELAQQGGVLAMVKRGGGFNSQGEGWEWFMLAPSGEVMAQGGADMMDGMCNACHVVAETQKGGADMVFPHPLEYAADAADFSGYRDWAQIDERTGPSPLLGPAHRPNATRRIYKKQLLANPDTPGQGYPVGTVLLKEVQDDGEVVEITAMVKRGGGFNPANKDWEWFMVDASTGDIAGRGANLMDGMCGSCHTTALDPSEGMDYVFKHTDDPFNR